MDTRTHPLVSSHRLWHSAQPFFGAAFLSYRIDFICSFFPAVTIALVLYFTLHCDTIYIFLLFCLASLLLPCHIYTWSMPNAICQWKSMGDICFPSLILSRSPSSVTPKKQIISLHSLCRVFWVVPVEKRLRYQAKNCRPFCHQFEYLLFSFYLSLSLSPSANLLVVWLCLPSALGGLSSHSRVFNHRMAFHWRFDGNIL